MNLNHVWYYRAQARMLTIAINNGQVERAPWEEALWGHRGRVNDTLPTTVTVPIELIKNHIAARGEIIATLPEGYR